MNTPTVLASLFLLSGCVGELTTLDGDDGRHTSAVNRPYLKCIYIDGCVDDLYGVGEVEYHRCDDGTGRGSGCYYHRRYAEIACGAVCEYVLVATLVPQEHDPRDDEDRYAPGPESPGDALLYCASSDDCSPYSTCQDGRCVSFFAVGCETSAECAADEECVDRRCESLGVEPDPEPSEPSEPAPGPATCSDERDIPQSACASYFSFDTADDQHCIDCGDVYGASEPLCRYCER